MPFHTGRVSFCRFRVTPGGDAPARVDDAALSILQEHKFQETEIGAPDEVEAGWVTGQHLLDTQFTYEKNGFGDAGSLLLVAMRIDTHKVPADLKQAYRKINEQAAAGGNPSGFASKAQKRDAQDVAGRQVQADLAAGKFRRSKVVPVLWDLASRTVYCGATSNKVIEQLADLMRRSFAVQIDPLSPGTLAGQLLRSRGRTRDWEDLHPSPFTDPPAEVRADDDGEVADITIPSVPWRSSAVDLKDFLGNEFLLWLWWKVETAEGIVASAPDHPGRPGSADDELFLAIDRALDMDCAWDARGKQTLRGHAPTKLREAGDALATGKWPRKAGLVLSDGEHQFELALQADRWHVSGGRLPEIPDAQNPRELTEARLALVVRLGGLIDGAFDIFLTERVGPRWVAGMRGEIRRWIEDRQ